MAYNVLLKQYEAYKLYTSHENSSLNNLSVRLSAEI